ncbi:PAS domain S-box protein [Aquincola sp. S2]|uniref:histidine kinase n=1 Tax=Pseudaquabacterium terrae TaxID=2732868 RepID=A0ABX2EJW3_9BURK|nr:PAS domain-containing sensor histidine kinase [Aquabacterium terrae]NRF68955.1 PAS domain S-box protein [Aquabacterium terrae]
MTPSKPLPAGPGVTPLGRRLLGRWWRRQSPARQDRFATLAPLVSVMLFLAAIISAFWYLRNEEIDREAEAVKRDTEIAQQQIRLRLIENQEQLVRMAREIVTRELEAPNFLAQAARFTADRPEILQLSWIGADRKVRARQSAFSERELPPPPKPAPTRFSSRSAQQAAAASAAEAAALAAAAASRPSEADWAFIAARDVRQPIYSRPFKDPAGTMVFELHVPLLDRGSFSGALVVEYSIDVLLRHFVPAEVTNRHAIAVIDERERVIASSVTPMPGPARAPALFNDVPLAPAANGLILRGSGYRTSVGLIGNTLFWMVVALSVLTVWMLLGTWRHMRRRSQIQGALVAETNFRRAMENSMLTGMRAMDLEGRVSYVNPAFCAMTGFTENELIGRLPPYPYWPHDRIEENSRLLQQELQGRSPAGGIEVKVMRKNGTLFDARMYVSPLVDARGHQTGWMTSMTNITEAKRIRDQLSASHERFTTVLEGLDAAVSVLSVQQGELLFANRSYRLWFGADARGHGLLASGAGPAVPFIAEPDDAVDGLSGLPTQELTSIGTNPREVYAHPLDKWFDVRSRYLQWTDGRLAQMLIATDITARRRAEEQASAQAEKAQVSSRLITMGEMASSVAHELNQPLTAITNYCSGMISRVKAETIQQGDLVAALEKTARQAERAGQIIHRIRAFVKKSEPQRQPAHAKDIVEDAVELASIELRRRNVAIHHYVAQRLPVLKCDPILVEQVLLNLLKNAAEAIDSAKLPAARRHIELRVIPRHTPEEGGVIEFSVTDMGPGLPEEVINRLYEAFFSTKAEGMGIGLSLCRSIVESHRGRIKAQNLYNGSSVAGCRFAFTLPVETSARHEETTLPPPPLNSRRTTVAPDADAPPAANTTP